MLEKAGTICAIDVHKWVLMAVIVGREDPQKEQAKKKFSAGASGRKDLLEWLRDHSVEAVVMESTAQYWWPLWIDLEPHFPLRLAQALSNAAPRGRKTDYRDALRLARRYLSEDLRFSYVPGQAQRQWRRLTRTWKSLGEQIVEARNEIEALLEEGQIKLSGILSDLIGTTGRLLLRALARGEEDVDTLLLLFHPQVKASMEQRREAVSGRLPRAHRLALDIHLDHIGFLESQRDQLQRCLHELMSVHQPVIQRLIEVPGINVVAAEHLIAEIGPTAEAFPSPEQLASWVGVAPGRQESGGQSSSDRCPKGNRFMRALICQIAHAATRTKGSFWEHCFESFKRRMDFRKALWAVAHRILKLIWKILKHNVDYIEYGIRADNPARLAEKMRRLKRDFKRQGFEISFTPIRVESTV